jgi:uncharacterized membrane protein YphA (DoxX/SURF4 family)
MKALIENEYVLLAARLIVGTLFIIVGIAKIADPQLFAKEIANYRLIPEFMVNSIAITLPWIELVSGLLLILGIRLRANAAIITILLLMFNIMVAIAWARGLDINCGCYSHIAQETVGLKKILENIGFMILSIVIYIFPKNNLSLEYLILQSEK